MLTLATNGAGTISVNPRHEQFSRATARCSCSAPAPADGSFANWSGDANGSTNPHGRDELEQGCAANFVQPPQITAQPQNAIVLPGETASFSVTAAGTAPLTFYWRFNGAPLSQSPQPMLTLTNVKRLKPETIRAVSNAYGTAISSNAQLELLGGCLGRMSSVTCTEAALRAATRRGGSRAPLLQRAITLTNTSRSRNHVTLIASGRSVMISGTTRCGCSPSLATRRSQGQYGFC
jgi:hypothetical protein